MKSVEQMVRGESLLPSPSEVYLIPDFLTEFESQGYFDRLVTEIQWEHQAIWMFGKKVLQPRLTAWYGDPGTDYSYSGLRLEPKPWSQTLEKLRRKLVAELGNDFNSVLLNLYRNGQDSMGWHRDNEKELGEEPVIASVSLGVARRMRFRDYASKKKKIELELSPGSLLVMRGATQSLWEHEIPKERALAEPRLNLTFRSLTLASTSKRKETKDVRR